MSHRSHHPAALEILDAFNRRETGIDLREGEQAPVSALRKQQGKAREHPVAVGIGERGQADERFDQSDPGQEGFVDPYILPALEVLLLDFAPELPGGVPETLVSLPPGNDEGENA